MIGRKRYVMGSVALVFGTMAPVVVSVISPTAAFAANLVVTTTADTGVGSLRNAVALASAAGGDVITFAWGVSPVVLTSGPIVINKSLTIRGNGAVNTAITRSAQAQTDFRIFDVVFQGAATIDMVTISGGREFGGAGIRNVSILNLSRSTVSGNTGLGDEGLTLGAGIWNDFSGSATITNSQIIGNSALGALDWGGGGVANRGLMSIANSSISNNTISGMFNVLGGGVYNSRGSSLTITDTFISGNSATITGTDGAGRGGGFYDGGAGGPWSITNSIVRGNVVAGGSLSEGEGAGVWADSSGTINRTEISGNQVTGGDTREGGGVYVTSDGQITTIVNITNTTIANNTAATDGGGLYNGDAGFATTNLISSTVAGNISSGSAVLSDVGTLSEKNTIVNNPGSATNCAGTIVNNGNNLVFGGALGTCPPGIGANPILAPLTDNGGINQTMAPTGNSSAINGGAGCPAVDQRNYTRTGTCDIGAYDVGGVLPDAATPVCVMTGRDLENTKKQNVTATDTGRGLQAFAVVQNLNSYIVIPFYLPRTNLTVKITAVKIDQSLTSIWRFNSTDAAGNTRLCE